MKKTPRFVAAAGVVLVAAAWMFFAPTKLGGSVDYVVTDGNSMEPLLHDGDLAIIRHSDEYQAGDVAAYNSPQLGRVVLHRIKAVENDTFTFKGDNNSWLDPERPQSPDMMGKLEWHIPAVGGILAKVGSPVPAAIVAAIVVALAGGLAQRRHRRDDGPEIEPMPQESLLSSTTFVRIARSGLAVAGVALVVITAFGATAFRRSTTIESTAAVGYEHRGRFAYSATTEKGLTAGGGRMGNGTPIFTKLSDEMNVRFTYALDSEARTRVNGASRLIVDLESDTGWSRPVAKTPWREFNGGQTDVRTNVDLQWLQHAVQKIREETGIVVGTYRLTFRPEIRVTGAVGAGTVSDKFSPELSFQVDEAQLIPLGASADQPLAALKPSEAGSVTTPVAEPATIALLRFEIPVTTARVIVVVVGLLALAALAFFGMTYRNALAGDESSRIAALYGDLVVEIKPGQFQGTLDVGNFDALVRLAGSRDELILYCKEEDCDAYFVIDGDQVFRYRVTRPAESPASESPASESLYELMPRLRSVVFVEELEEAHTA